MSTFIHVFLILPVAIVVVKREALVAQGRQQRQGGIAAAQWRRRRAHRHRLQALPPGARHEDGEGAGGGPRPGPAVGGGPNVGRWRISPPPPGRPHRARQVQTGGGAAGTCAPSRPRARRAGLSGRAQTPRCHGDAWRPRGLCPGLPRLAAHGLASLGRPSPSQPRRRLPPETVTARLRSPASSAPGWQLRGHASLVCCGAAGLGC